MLAPTKTIAHIGIAAAIAAAALLVAPTAQAASDSNRLSSDAISAEFLLCRSDPFTPGDYTVLDKQMKDYGTQEAFMASLPVSDAHLYGTLFADGTCEADDSSWLRYSAALAREKKAGEQATQSKPEAKPVEDKQPTQVRKYSLSQAKSLATKEAKAAAAKVGASKSDKSKAAKTAKTAGKKAELKAEKSSAAKKSAKAAAKKVSKKSWSKAYKKAYSKALQKAGAKAYSKAYKATYSKAVKAAAKKAKDAAYKKTYAAAYKRYSTMTK